MPVNKYFLNNFYEKKYQDVPFYVTEHFITKRI